MTTKIISSCVLCDGEDTELMDVTAEVANTEFLCMECKKNKAKTEREQVNRLDKELNDLEKTDS